MASSYLGPESPRPLAVVSEGYQRRYRIPAVAEYEKFSFGPQYEERMFELIHKYLELGTTDRLCYVGESKGSFAQRIIEKFCLLEPIMNVIPGHFSYVETDTQKMLPIRIAHTGAEEYFRQLAKDDSPTRTTFDKVVLKDAIRYFETPTETYENIMKCVSEFGRMLIIHRPSNLNTLPVFTDAKNRLFDNETPYMDIIKGLQACNLDVQWEIEVLPILMPKRKWFGMLRNKFPPQMEIMSDFEIVGGVRELSEGVLKYPGELVEFVDRLLFITVSPSLLEDGFPKIQRYGTNAMTPYPSMKDLKLSMDVTPDIQHLLPNRKAEKELRKFPWS